MRLFRFFRTDNGNRSYGNETGGRITACQYQRLPISEDKCLFHWHGRRPDDHPGLSDLGL
jgi:nuclear transport factor 2 (NTF2) superfamily protein